ncbi:hypothetical protein C8J57DRAFT_1673927 [Mycena rebaudengoi]|nr:hypothetical protein C8J57DRAFT_1673927 [Mycena rebaudengoi]
MSEGSPFAHSSYDRDLVQEIFADMKTYNEIVLETHREGASPNADDLHHAAIIAFLPGQLWVPPSVHGGARDDIMDREQIASPAMLEYELQAFGASKRAAYDNEEALLWISGPFPPNAKDLAAIEQFQGVLKTTQVRTPMQSQRKENDSQVPVRAAASSCSAQEEEAAQAMQLELDRLSYLLADHWHVMMSARPKHPVSKIGSISRRARRDRIGFISYDGEPGDALDEWAGGPKWHDFRECQAVGFCLESVELAVYMIKQIVQDSVVESLDPSVTRPAVLRLTPRKILYSLYAYHPNGASVHELNHRPAHVPTGNVMAYSELVDHLRFAYADETPLLPLSTTSRWFASNFTRTADPLKPPSSPTHSLDSDAACRDALQFWDTELEALRRIGGQLLCAISRICQVIDFLDLQDNIRRVAFATEEHQGHIGMKTEAVLFHLRLYHPDLGRAPPHQNSFLHGYEIDFLRAVCIGLRGRNILHLSFYIEKLLDINFIHGDTLQDLLRQGYLNPVTLMDTETLGNRLREMQISSESPCYPDSWAR